MKVRFLSCIFSVCCFVNIVKSESSQSFAHFLHEFVQPQDWDSFKQYYETRLQSVRKKVMDNGGSYSADDLATLSQMEKRGEVGIKKVCPDIHTLTASCSDEQESKKVLKVHCIRYAAYEDFLSNRCKESATLAGKMSGYWRSVKQRMVCWAQSVRSLVTRG